MLRSANELESFTIRATDGDVGRVKDVYVDDDAWVVRYLVVQTGNWLSGRRVLISPFSVDHPTWEDRIVPVAITREQVRDCPVVDSELPVSRQYELGYLRFYGYPTYWGGLGYWGDGFYPTKAGPGVVGLRSATGEDRGEVDPLDGESKHTRQSSGDPHLRSCNAISGYHVEAGDGEIGHVHGLLIDLDTWAVRYLIVNTSNWWMGHLVLVAPEWIDAIHWLGATVSVGLTRQQVKDAPEYEPGAMIDRDWEIGMFRHYGRTGYWEHEDRPADATRIDRA